MAKGDRVTGTHRGLSNEQRKGIDTALFEEMKKVAISKTEQATVVVGDFLAELMLAFSYREKTERDEGDWISDPTAVFTDGKVFSTEERTMTSGRFQLTLSLDCSESMYNANLMGKAGPTFIALDKMIRMAMQDLPEGTLVYQPFIFHDRAFAIPEDFIPLYQQHSVQTRNKPKKGETIGTVREGGTTWRMSTPHMPPKEVFEAALAAGHLPEHLTVFKSKAQHKGATTASKLKSVEFYESALTNGHEASAYFLRALDTYITPLFKAIQRWEQDNDPDAVRLDLVITDGHLEPLDVEQASVVQNERGGRTRTIFLNFLSRDKWSEEHLPEGCYQYETHTYNLTNTVRNAIEESIRDLL